MHKSYFTIFFICKEIIIIKCLINDIGAIMKFRDSRVKWNWMLKRKKMNTI